MDREKQREYQRAWYQKNREKVLKQQREYQKRTGRKPKSQWAKKNPEVALDYILKRNYNITLERFREMERKQDGKCLFCSKRPEYRLCVDHCHKTGKVRGLLCRPCNSILGLVEERPEVLEAAARYLESHNLESVRAE